MTILSMGSFTQHTDTTIANVVRPSIGMALNPVPLAAMSDVSPGESGL
jgi:hypothetical protein